MKPLPSPGFVLSPQGEKQRKLWREGRGNRVGVDSESAFSSCRSLWGSTIRSRPKNSNGRCFKCKTAGFGAAASLRV